MKNYELTYLISPEIKEDELRSFSQKITASIQENGGILDSISKPIFRRLAYPIQKKNIAYFQSLIFSLKPENLENLKNFLISQKNIIRFILLRKKIVSRKKAITRPYKKIIQPPLLEKKEKAEKKVELKDLDKKLEEILGGAQL